MSKSLQQILNSPRLAKRLKKVLDLEFGEVELPTGSDNQIINVPYRSRAMVVPNDAAVVVQPDGFRTFNISDKCAERVRGIAGYLCKHTDLRAVERVKVDDGLRLALMIGLDQLEAEAKRQADFDAELAAATEAGIREVS